MPTPSAPHPFAHAKRIERLKKKKPLLLELLDAIYVDQRRYNLVESLAEARKIAASL